jgi:hypothetical protein
MAAGAARHGARKPARGGAANVLQALGVAGCGLFAVTVMTYLAGGPAELDTDGTESTGVSTSVTEGGTSGFRGAPGGTTPVRGGSTASIWSTAPPGNLPPIGPTAPPMTIPPTPTTTSTPTPTPLPTPRPSESPTPPPSTPTPTPEPTTPPPTPTEPPPSPTPSTTPGPEDLPPEATAPRNRSRAAPQLPTKPAAGRSSRALLG